VTICQVDCGQPRLAVVEGDTPAIGRPLQPRRVRASTPNRHRPGSVDELTGAAIDCLQPEVAARDVENGG
jgi:hypothetical protein